MECAASVLGSIGAAASLLWEERTGEAQPVSVAARWFTEAPVAAGEPTGFGDLAPYLTTSDTPYGRLRHFGPVADLPGTPARWEVPTSPIGTHAPRWHEATARI